MRALRLAVIALLVLPLLPTAASATEDGRIGRVKTMEGEAWLVRGDDRSEIAIHDPIHLNDRVVTEDGAVGITFLDDTRFTVGPDSDMVIDDFVFDPGDGALDFSATMVKGAMSYFSGRIAKISPEVVTINTPVATAGIRGTYFAVEMDPGTDGTPIGPAPYVSGLPNDWWLAPLESRPPRTTFVLLPDETGEVGAITVTNAIGEVTLEERGQASDVPSADDAPTLVGALSEDEIASRFGDVLDVLPPAPVSFTLFFDPGTTDLTAESLASLPAVLEEIGRRDSVDVNIAGHTDRAGTDAANRALSEQRAEVVRAALLEIGVREDAVISTYHGEADPAVPTADGVAEPRNRRVEVIVQ